MIFMPYVISSTIVSFFATLLFSPNIGFLNKFFEWIGHSEWQSAWFGDPNRAFKLMIILIIWQGAGSGIMIFYSNLMDISQDIMESCRIDGCNEFFIFLKIVLPCIRPAIISLCLLIFLWSWNSYLLPLVMINNVENYTIPLYIQSLGNEHRKDIAAQITGLLISVLPLIAAFAVFSKDFIRGLTEGAVKG